MQKSEEVMGWEGKEKVQGDVEKRNPGGAHRSVCRQIRTCLETNSLGKTLTPFLGISTSGHLSQVPIC